MKPGGTPFSIKSSIPCSSLRRLQAPAHPAQKVASPDFTGQPLGAPELEEASSPRPDRVGHNQKCVGFRQSTCLQVSKS